MKNISLFRKIKLFRTYKKFISKNRNELSSKFGLRVDSAWRLYTVLNIPQELIGESYSIKKSDIDKISQSYIREYTIELSKFFDANGLKELYDYYNVDKVGRYSYLLVFGFSLFRSNVFYNNIYYKVIPSILFLILVLILSF